MLFFAAKTRSRSGGTTVYIAQDANGRHAWPPPAQRLGMEIFPVVSRTPISGAGSMR